MSQWPRASPKAHGKYTSDAYSVQYGSNKGQSHQKGKSAVLNILGGAHIR
jgi:hypothetical protein